MLGWKNYYYYFIDKDVDFDEIEKLVKSYINKLVSGSRFRFGEESVLRIL